MSNPSGKFFIPVALKFIAFIALIGLLFMSLWNWLMPTIFGLPFISYGQALGLLLLSKLLFSGITPSWSRQSPPTQMKERWREKWQQQEHHVPQQSTPTTPVAEEQESEQKQEETVY